MKMRGAPCRDLSELADAAFVMTRSFWLKASPRKYWIVVVGLAFSPVSHPS